MSRKIRAVIVTDHYLFADLVMPVLRRMGIVTVRHFDFVKPALTFLKSGHLELVVIDQVMPAASQSGEDATYDRTGIAISYEVVLRAITYIRKHHPSIKTVAVTEDHEPVRCARLVKAGVHGIVCKPYGLHEFRSVVRQVLNGVDSVVSQPLQPLLLAQLVHPMPALGQRELQILRLVQQGMANKTIAIKLDIKPNAVRNGFARICKKLQVRGRIEAIAKATEYGFLEYYY